MGGQPPQYPQQPGYQQPGQGGYGQQPYGQPKTNGMAVTALVLGILGLFCWIGSIPAIIFGVMGRKQIRESNGAETGDGMAMAGLIMGIIGAAILVVYLILLAVGAATFEFST
jgi:hypothetical protein